MTTQTALPVFVFDHDYKIVQFEQAETFTLWCYVSGTAVECTSANVVCYGHDGDELTHDTTGADFPSTACTIAESTPYAISFDLASDYTKDDQEMNCFAEYTIVYSTVTYIVRQPFHISNYKLYPLITDTDLSNIYPDIANWRWSGQSNYNIQIHLACDIITTLLEDKGLTPQNIYNPARMRMVETWKTLSIIFGNFIKEEGDLWDVRKRDADKNFDLCLQALLNSMHYDIDESKTIESEETDQSHANQNNRFQL